MSVGEVTTLPRQTETAPGSGVPAVPQDVVLDCQIKELYYGNFKAVRDTAIPIRRHSITAFIGPSGCGKSTVLRCLNRMNDLVRGFRFEHVRYRGRDIYHAAIDPVAVRRFIGMVFQQPNPFAATIYNNVAFGLRLNGFKGNTAEKVENALRGAALWDEVKDKLQKSGLSLSGGQQQRLCIARAIATEPEVLLMDEPCSALDPIATRKIEDLMRELRQRFTIAIVTHNLQQAQRVADYTGFLYVDTSQGARTGYLVEFGESHNSSTSRHLHTQQRPRRVQLMSPRRSCQPRWYGYGSGLPDAVPGPCREGRRAGKACRWQAAPFFREPAPRSRPSFISNGSSGIRTPTRNSVIAYAAVGSGKVSGDHRRVSDEDRSISAPAMPR